MAAVSYCIFCGKPEITYAYSKSLIIANGVSACINIGLLMKNAVTMLRTLNLVFLMCGATLVRAESQTDLAFHEQATGNIVLRYTLLQFGSHYELHKITLLSLKFNHFGLNFEFCICNVC